VRLLPLQKGSCSFAGEMASGFLGAIKQGVPPKANHHGRRSDRATSTSRQKHRLTRRTLPERLVEGSTRQQPHGSSLSLPVEAPQTRGGRKRADRGPELGDPMPQQGTNLGRGRRADEMIGSSQERDSIRPSASGEGAPAVPVGRLLWQPRSEPTRQKYFSSSGFE
jgi:hypothetical protein